MIPLFTNSGIRDPRYTYTTDIVFALKMKWVTNINNNFIKKANCNHRQLIIIISLISNEGEETSFLQ